MKNIFTGCITALVLLVFVVPLFLPSSFRVERTETIPAPRAAVFAQVANLGQWAAWSPWYKREVAGDFEVQGPPGGVGSRLAWHGATIGSGQQTLVHRVTDTSLTFALQFRGPSSSPATATWSFADSEPQSTQVTWKIEGPLSYPLERYFGLFLPKLLDNNFSQGLSSLQGLLEQK